MVAVSARPSRAMRHGASRRATARQFRVRKRDGVAFDLRQLEVDRYPIELDDNAVATDANFGIDLAVFVRHVKRHLGRPHR